MNEYLIILGLRRPCTQQDIKVAFRKLAHIHHPDKGGSAEKFKQINNAYQELKKYGDIGSAPEPLFQRTDPYRRAAEKNMNDYGSMFYGTTFDEIRRKKQQELDDMIELYRQRAEAMQPPRYKYVFTNGKIERVRVN